MNQRPLYVGVFFGISLMNSYRRFILCLPILLLLPLAATCYSVYQAGFSGDFIFDDLPNLELLADIPTPATLSGITEFVISGVSSTLGRPVSLLTFALQADHWPDNAEAFKQVNLAIHLLNGLLVYLLVLQIGKRVAPAHARWLGLLVTALWLLHPLHVSTVTYVIQRMNLLSAFFVLAGINLYLMCRNFTTLSLPGAIGLLTGTGLCTLLGVLSKENAVLLPLYILVIEFTLHARADNTGYWRLYRLLGLWLPVTLLAAYLAFKFPDTRDSFVMRPFTLGERLLSEARVLITYLGQIVAPLPSKLGIFQDDFVISRGLAQPLTTLFSLATIVSLLGSAIALRQRQPLYAFAVLWFFAGHSLEAGIVNLELYFEHRNYLPALGILTGLVFIVHRWTEGNRKMRSVAVGAFMIFLGIYSLLGYQEAKIWGNEKTQTTVWYQEHPDSKRARQRYAAKLLYLGRYEESYQLISSVSRDWPRDSGSRLLSFMFRCFHSGFVSEPVDPLAMHLAKSSYDSGAVKQIHDLADWLVEEKCETVTKSEFKTIANALLDNPAFKLPRAKGNIYFDLARVTAATGDYEDAARIMNRAYQQSRAFNVKLMSASYWLMAKNIDEAELALAELQSDLDNSFQVNMEIQEAVTNLRREIENSKRDSNEHQ